MSKVFVLNGPNLGRLGSRQPEVYGVATLSDLAAELAPLSSSLGFELDFRQTDSEAELIGWLHEAVDARANVVLNPAAFTHYSYALADAAALVTSAGLKLIEVHISNTHARESFRKTSVISPVATGTIAGFGTQSYKLAIQAL
jgi:3-dehydroquinate dehydratase-2